MDLSSLIYILLGASMIGFENHIRSSRKNWPKDRSEGIDIFKKKGAITQWRSQDKEQNSSLDYG